MLSIVCRRGRKRGAETEPVVAKKVATPVKKTETPEKSSTPAGTDTYMYCVIKSGKWTHYFVWQLRQNWFLG